MRYGETALRQHGLRQVRQPPLTTSLRATRSSEESGVFGVVLSSASSCCSAQAGQILVPLDIWRHQQIAPFAPGAGTTIVSPSCTLVVRICLITAALHPVMPVGFAHAGDFRM